MDGHGLIRPQAGIGTYTREVLAAMLGRRPQDRLTVYLPPGAVQPLNHPHLAWREIPATRFAGRHLQWPGRIRRLGAAAFFGPAGQLPLGSVGCPAAITIHDLAIYRNPAWFPGRQPLSTRVLVPRSIRRADSLIAVSQNTAGDLMEMFGIPSERITVIPHGVSRAFRPMDPDQLAAARARLGLPKRFVLFVGTIEPRKNLLTLLEAWAMLPQRPPLVVAGGWGWRYEEIQARLERLGDGVRLLGGVQPEDLPALYNLATCLAHPAWYEGFGLTPLEAMACGIPVIASSTSSLPEVVGDAGILVDPADASAWTRALARVLGDPDAAADMRRRGIVRAAEFTWERTAEATWRVIESLTTS